MFVNLYTSRVVLNSLGIEDFGIYNIVAGIIVLFSFLNNAMTTATQRFLNYELGKNDIVKVRQIFSMSMTAHISIAILVIFLAETLGLWFLNTQLNIVDYRIYSANFVYQFSIFTFCIQILCIPYNASIIAYEKMSFYAYISVIEVTLKLLVVYLLLYFTFDKLIVYSILIFIVAVVVSIIYKYYCLNQFATCRYRIFWDKTLYMNLMSFSGWNLFGSIANIASHQGLNILLNIFFGVQLNAVMGIANQVNNAVYSFVSNFQIAFNPQIVKSYSSKNKEYFVDLIFLSSKFSFYLLLIIALPVLICCDFILQIWLNIVPEYAVYFCRLMILYSLLEAISAPFWMAVQATGIIKKYQIIVSFIILLNLPVSFFILWYGISLKYVLIAKFLIGFLTLFFRVLYLYFSMNFPLCSYIKNVLIRLIIVSFCSLLLPLLVNYFFSDWKGLIFIILSSMISVVFFVFIGGLEEREKIFVKNQIKNAFNIYRVK
jgi:O-antigen/teichoic acid export membrane protein